MTSSTGPGSFSRTAAAGRPAGDAERLLSALAPGCPCHSAPCQAPSAAALATVEEALEIDPGDPYGYYYGALIRFQIGDKEAALDSLEIALDKGYPAGLLVPEPYLGDLRENARFHEMIIASFQ